MDAEADARRMRTDTGATFALAWGLDAEAVSRTFGTYYDPDGGYLHAAGLLVRPDATVHLACYSSGSIGRLAAADVAAVLEGQRED